MAKRTCGYGNTSGNASNSIPCYETKVARISFCDGCGTR